MFWTTKVLNILLALLESNRAILKILRLRQPEMVFLTVVSEDEGMLKFVLNLPAKSAVDVVKREVTITIGSGSPTVIELDGDALVTAELEGQENDPVVGQLVDIDDAVPANRSPAKDFSFVLVDTIAPPMPGDVGLTVTAEV
jgi:hypothetical protein